MHDELIRRLNETKTMSIVGMCKNAGKTTMLNWLLTAGHLRGTLGLTSIGRDGESTDVVTGTEKPGIFVREGTLIATAKDMLRLGDVTKEILMTTGIPTPLGEVVIMRARSAGYVQLAGPSITTQLRSVSESFFALGAEKSVIDGALGRKSLGARAVAEGVILCTGASYNASMEKVIAASSVSSATSRTASLSSVSALSSTLLGSLTTRRHFRSTPLRSSGTTIVSVSAPVTSAAPYSLTQASSPSGHSGGSVSALGRFISR